jgi:hypothetical protein
MADSDQIQRMEAFLSRLRAQTGGTPTGQEERWTECWLLSGAIDDLKNGRTSVLEVSAKYLRWMPHFYGVV